MDTFKIHSTHLRYDYLLDLQPTSEARKREYYQHMHNDYEILFFYKGNADYIIENQRYHLNTNDMLIIKPMVYHGLHVLSSEPYERCVFNFARSILTEEQIRFLDETSPIHHLESNGAIHHIFDTMRASEDLLSSAEFEFMTNSSLHNILSLLKHLPMGNSPIKSETKLDEIIAFINTHPELSLNSQTLANRFYVSKSWLDHTFKTYLKISLKQYINQKKVLYAQSLILSGTLPTKAAELCNYKNYTTFYRQYLYFLGHEPYLDRKGGSTRKSHSGK